MKKLKIVFRIIGIVTAVCIFLLFLYVCYSMMRIGGYSPYLQPQSKWVSADKRICFTVVSTERGEAYGTMQFEDETIDIIILFYVDGRAAVHYNYNGERGDMIFLWYSKYIRKNKFTAQVIKANAYYSAHNRIKFRCIEGKI